MGLAKFTVSVEAPSFEEEDVVTGITLAANHILVLVDASPGAVNITLPDVADHNGIVYIFKKIDSSGNSVTLVGAIDGEENLVLNLQYQYATIAGDSNRLTWHIIGGEYVKMEELLGKILDELKSETEKLKEIDKKLEALE